MGRAKPRQRRTRADCVLRDSGGHQLAVLTVFLSVRCPPPPPISVNMAVRLLAQLADNRLKVSETVVTEPRVINNSGNCLEIYCHGKIRFAKNIPELRN